MIDFTKKMKKSDAKKNDNPIDIYESLDRTSLAGPLRVSQEKVLRKWYEEKIDKKDTIIKLHTGEGKTLIGLLILLTKLNRKEEPCVYICPNKYLVGQVCKEAVKFGIQVCTIGENNLLPNEFMNGNRILVTHVQKMFNGKTIFGTGNLSEPIGAIVLDDAHACIDSIRDAFVIKIKRNKNRELYEKFLDLFEADLIEQGEGTFWDIKHNDDYESLKMIPYWSWIEKKSQVLEILASNEKDGSITFVWPLIKDMLEHCQAFINGGELQIMPVVAPINMFGSFSNAKHRVLMSATTQDDSFFVKLLGVSVEAIKNPVINEEQKWSGEKMLLIPSLISDKFTRDAMIEYFGKMTFKFGAVALTPTWKKQDDYREFGCVLLDKDNIANEIECLQKGFWETGKMRILANRYDGIDLPDNSCRILILDSLPFFVNMADKFEQTARRGSRLISKKLAQKIEQGLGRSVRSEKDYSVIIFIGSELVSFIRSNATRELFSLQTQKQIELGLQMAEWANEEKEDVQLADLKSLINQCLKRDEGWKALYESEMNDIQLVEISRDDELRILSLEAKAEKLYLQKKYDEAVEKIQNLLDQYVTELSDKGWYLQLMAQYKYFSSKVESQKFQRAAYECNFELLKPQEGVAYKKIDNINLNRVENIRKRIAAFANYDELMLEINRVCECFSFGVEANKFEDAIEQLGLLLGYKSQRPDKTIKKGPDNLWGMGNNSFIMIECKSEVSQGRNSIHKSEVGQMNNHCGWFESEYDDAKVLRIMIIPTINVAYDADFTHEVRVMRKNKLNLLKKNVMNFFKEFKKYDLNNLTENFINQCLEAHDLSDFKIVNNYVENTKKLER